jgi:hypothetical protein
MPSFRAAKVIMAIPRAETSGLPGVQVLPAQSSSLAIGSAGRSNCEIPNGLGSEFCLWSIASSMFPSMIYSTPSCATLSVQYWAFCKKKLDSMPLSGHCDAKFVRAADLFEQPGRCSTLLFGTSGVPTR